MEAPRQSATSRQLRRGCDFKDAISKRGDEMQKGQKRMWRDTLRGMRMAAMVLFAFAALTGVAGANQWNEKTILTFSEPVMVPGATLQPGSYVFKLLDSNANRHTVEIWTKDDSSLVTTTHAVPTKRMEPKGDVVLKFNPTEPGTPIALKGWFYPGSVYGHEFVYPPEQARKIAERTKTIVLSVDVPGKDLEKGTIHTYNASGQKSEWRGDETTMREWDTWQRNRSSAAQPSASEQKPQATGQSAKPAGAADQKEQRPAPDRKEQRQATAPMMKNDPQGMPVRIDQLEDNAQRYLSKTVTVDGEVDDVHGPRVFTIDEPNWGDLEGEILVYVPSNLAALVREDDRVTVTGTVKPFVRADVEREWGWLDMDRDVEVRLSKRPVLVASRIVGGNNDLAMVIDVAAGEASKPVGTTGSSAAVTNLSTLATGNQDLIGRRVDLDDIRIDSMAKDTGFFVKDGGTAVFVLPAHPDRTSVKASETVSLSGVVLQMPKAMKSRLNLPSGGNDEIYIYATNVSR
jgi:hypothetical protein